VLFCSHFDKLVAMRAPSGISIKVRGRDLLLFGTLRNVAGVLLDTAVLVAEGGPPISLGNGSA